MTTILLCFVEALRGLLVAMVWGAIHQAVVRRAFSNRSSALR